MHVSNIVDRILEGVDLREALADAGEEFITNAEKFGSYLQRKYPFVTKVVPDIEPETKYVSNFFIEVDTVIDYYMPEDSIARYSLEDVVQGEKIYYGIGDDGEVEYDIHSVCRDLSDMMYKDSFKFGLVPVMTKKSYSIMKYSKDSYYYKAGRTGDKLHLRLEFYTDRGLKTK